MMLVYFIIFLFIANTHALQKGVMALSEELHFKLNPSYYQHITGAGTDKDFSTVNGSGKQSKVNAGFNNEKTTTLKCAGQRLDGDLQSLFILC